MCVLLKPVLRSNISAAIGKYNEKNTKYIAALFVVLMNAFELKFNY